MIRLLTPNERAAAFDLVKLLRTHLDARVFLKALAHPRMSEYQLAASFDGDELTGVVGFRSVCTLARGHHIHVDDLVVGSGRQRQGIGRELMEWVEQYAREQGMKAVFLDARPGAAGFYEAMDYELHASPLMRKTL